MYTYKRKMGKDYTNGELGIILEGMEEHMIEIKNKVDFTNGQVKSLQMWKQFLLGAWAVLSLITPIAWYLISVSIQNFQLQVDQSISQAINNNNDKYFEK